MLFCARNTETIYNSLSEFFATDAISILRELRKIPQDDRDDAIKKYIRDNQKKHITEIEFYHLSRSISPHQKLYPLNYLLLEETDLSSFFREHGITFDRSGDKSITLLHNGLKVDDNIVNNHFLLGKRLSSDMCICGFQILENIDRFKAGYLHDILKKSPEIVKSVDEALELGGDLIEDYSEKSRYYCEIGVAKFSEIGFNKGLQCEIYPNIDYSAKAEVYVYGMLSYELSNYSSPDFRTSTNAMIYCESSVEIIDRIPPEEIWPEEIVFESK